MLEIGSVLNNQYKILSEIGRGGMSVVYLAINERASKTWAVKEISRKAGEDSMFESPVLAAEARMLKKLRHPNLPSIVDIIENESSLILVMDYIEGDNLQTVLKQSGAQPADRVIGWAKQLADVLGYLHSRRPPIIYRDMKPANVMLQPDGRVSLIDFGTAREYKPFGREDTTWLGTRGYAAPEQFGGRGQTDPRTDIYCLGATLYHLLTGFSPADTQFCIYPLGQLNPAFSGSGIEKVVSKCCEPDPQNRYRDCAELLYALEHVHEEDQAAVTERNRRWYGFLFGLVLTAAGVAGMIGFSCAKIQAVNASYETCLSQAQNTSEAAIAAGCYSRAIELQPGRAEAYERFLGDLCRDGTITKGEKQGLEDLLNRSAENGDGTRSNLEYFKDASPKEYAEFLFSLGQSYYAFYENGKREANICFGEVQKNPDLSEEKRAIAASMSAITDYYVNLENSRKSWAGQAGGTYSYADFWKKLTGLISDPAKAEEKAGGRVYALAACRELAAQITFNLKSFSDAGISQEEIKKALKTARMIVEMPCGDEKEEARRELGKQALQALDSAGYTYGSWYREQL